MTSFNKTTKLAVAALASTFAFSGATIATTTAANAGVTGCSAPGGKQEAGALIGAVVGGVIGSNLAKNERGLGTVVGAGAGAAAGSAIGCEQQKKRAGYATYKGRNAWVARSNLKVRSGPSTGARQVGSLYAGQTFQSLGASRDGRWVMVGQNGNHIGYVSKAYVQPA
jgi:uncharacterized protein YcfJ